MFKEKQMQAIILAGGKGTRLKPYTLDLPKSLVPIKETPILEIVIRQLKNNQFSNITLAVGHLAELIKSHFNNGEKFGVKIKYSAESKPLGTAGPLKLITDLNENFLVMNSDDLTDFNYKNFFEYHKKNKAIVTIGIFNKKVNIDLGVLEVGKKNEIIDYIEKPAYNFNVSMGIYAFNKKAIDYIPKDEYFDFPTLIKKLMKNNQKILSYQHNGYWLDIGRPEDYEKANEDFGKIF